MKPPGISYPGGTPDTWLLHNQWFPLRLNWGKIQAVIIFPEEVWVDNFD
jgi:hypothetical protein